MKTEHALSILLISVIIAIFNLTYIRHLSMTIEQNGMVFEQVGLAGQKIDGETLYFPVYKLRTQ